MLIGALLVLAWIILLVRYPARALPVSLGALLMLGLIGAWLLFQEQRDTQRLARLELRLSVQLARCPADRPLEVLLVNGSDAPLRALSWEVAAYLPGRDVNLARRGVAAAHYQGPEVLAPGERWQQCLPLPELRPGYQPATLTFIAESLHARFAD